MSSDPYDRQRRLAEVGAAGQERIARSEARLAAGPAAATALAYVVRAGVERGVITSGESAPFPHAARFHFAAPGAVAAGAHAALRHLVSILKPQ